MNYVLIFNGLGNQMSQYAFYLAKKRVDKQCRLLVIDNPNSHNGYELERVFGIMNNETRFDSLVKWVYTRFYHRWIFKYLVRILGVNEIREPLNYNYTPSLLLQKNMLINIYIGGWHSEKYFKNLTNEVKSTFSFKEINDEIYLELLGRIKLDKNSVSLHVRRGDYLNIKSTDYWQLGGVATDEYYQKAIDYISVNVETPHFYIFSNDMEWCKQNIRMDNVTYVTINQGLNSWRDMHCMSMCRHHIMANSTFSWWGAWLSPYGNGITLHPKWFIHDIETPDFYPERWKCIE